MRAIYWLSALVAAILFLAGCGGGGGSDSAETSHREETIARPSQPSTGLRITLDGYPSPTNVGILMADKLGYFKDVGLDNLISHPASPGRPVRYVAGRWVDISISHQPQVALAQENGIPIVAIGSIIPQPTAAMIWLKRSGINGIADLKGKTIATQGLPFQEALLETVLARAGLTLADVKVEKVYYKLVSALAGGRADAIFGTWNLEGAQLKARGLEPVVTSVQDLGIPAYDELVLIARRDRLSEDPQSIRRFMTALARGTAAAVKDPKRTIKVIEESIDAIQSSPKARRKEVKAQVEATLPLLSKSGYMNPDRASGLSEWMREQGLIERELPASELLSNDYVVMRP